MKYIIKESHSGTSKKEIEKAKRFFRKSVKDGEFYDPGKIVIKFSDINYVIKATYVDAETYEEIGEKIIYDGRK